MTARRTEHFFVAFDKTPIHYIATDDPSVPHQASVILVHGAGEHAARYDDFAAFLAPYGFAIYAMDLRGYGKSGGYPAHVRSFDDYSKDIQAIVNKLKNEEEKRIFLFGHSMGGLIAASAAAKYKGEFTGLVLSSPCFRLAFTVPGYLLAIAEVMSVIYPTYSHATKMQADWLTHDLEIVKDHMTDKQIRHFISSRLYCLMSREMSASTKTAERITCPVFIGQAADDFIVNKEASRAFFDHLAGKDKEFKLYEGFFHEILNEIRRQEPYSDILNWLNRVINR